MKNKKKPDFTNNVNYLGHWSRFSRRVSDNEINEKNTKIENRQTDIKHKMRKTLSSMSPSVCPFVALSKATYAENSHIVLSSRYILKSVHFLNNLLRVQA